MKTFFVSLALTLFFSACLENRPDDQSAGTSTTSGNPTEIKVSFADSTGQTNFSGTVEVYAATQIPITGFQPFPLISFTVESVTDFILEASFFRGIPDTLWPLTSRSGDSLRYFNLVLRSDSLGSINHGFAYNKSENRFSKESLVKAGLHWTIMAPLVPLIDKDISVSRVSQFEFHFLFIIGTSFLANGEDFFDIGKDSAIFHFKGVPRGKHELAFLEIVKPGHGNAYESKTVWISKTNQPFSPEYSGSILPIDEYYDSVPLPLVYRLR